MTSFKMPDEILALPPENRVVAAGLVLLKHLRRMPTQDQLVQALSRDGDEGTSTGKGTVNKYWPSLQNEIARELSLAKWLPAELPEFVIDHLKQLIDWARKDADAQLAEYTSALKERERVLDAETETRKATEATLRNRIRELEATLNERDTTIGKQSEKLVSLDLALADLKGAVAVQEEQLINAAKREADLTENYKELKDRLRLTNETLSGANLELHARQKDISLLENQLQSLQHRHDEQMRFISNQKDQLSDLEERVSTANLIAANSRNALLKAQETLQSNETQLARQEGQLAVLDALKSSVETLKDALAKEQERNEALKRDKESLSKQVRQLERKTAKKPASD